MLQQMEAQAAYVLSLGLATLFLLIWLVHRQRTSGGFTLWLASGVAGVLLGSIGSYAVMSAAGFKAIKVENAPNPNAGSPSATAMSAPQAAPGGAMGMGGGMRGGMGGGMGGGGRPNPKRDLSMLVRKLNLLTDDITIKLTPDQSTALVKGLSGIDEAEKFTDDDAKTMHEELMAVLTEDQRTKLDAIGVPGGRGVGGGGMGGGAPPDPNANPFSQENNLKALTSFRGRFAGSQSEAAKSTGSVTAPAESPADAAQN